MVEGRLRKEFYQQVVLLQQTFLGAGGDGKATVEQVLKGAEKTAGAPIKIAKFVRYALGEGIDKKDEDFAAEVAKAGRQAAEAAAPAVESQLKTPAGRACPAGRLHLPPACAGLAMQALRHDAAGRR